MGFRGEHIEETRFAFDLGNYDDVTANATGIYQRLLDGSMSRDEAWPQERIALFHQWMEEAYMS
jgi:hypothetical protein